MNLALFDFDGTITTRDTFTQFVYFAVEPKRIAAGKLKLAPLVIGYRLGLVSGSTLRRSVARLAFRGTNEAAIRELGQGFAERMISKWVRSEALERIAWHKAQGDVVVVVSAGLGLYLANWCAAMAVDLIATDLESKDGMLTGRYAGADCCGSEKRRRVLERYDVASYPIVYAYGDTREDDEMLSLAHRKYYRGVEVRA